MRASSITTRKTTTTTTTTKRNRIRVTTKRRAGLKKIGTRKLNHYDGTILIKVIIVVINLAIDSTPLSRVFIIYIVANLLMTIENNFN